MKATERSTERTEAPTLTAGRALDALVAEKVMGFPFLPDFTPDFSTDMGAAWKVVEAMVGPGMFFDIHVAGSGMCDTSIWVRDDVDVCIAEQTDIESAPLAICLAAIQAMTPESDCFIRGDGECVSDNECIHTPAP